LGQRENQNGKPERCSIKIKGWMSKHVQAVGERRQGVGTLVAEEQKKWSGGGEHCKREKRGAMYVWAPTEKSRPCHTLDRGRSGAARVRQKSNNITGGSASAR